MSVDLGAPDSREVRPLAPRRDRLGILQLFVRCGADAISQDVSVRYENIPASFGRGRRCPMGAALRVRLLHVVAAAHAIAQFVGADESLDVVVLVGAGGRSAT